MRNCYRLEESEDTQQLPAMGNPKADPKQKKKLGKNQWNAHKLQK